MNRCSGTSSGAVMETSSYEWRRRRDAVHIRDTFRCAQGRE
jgi:hypothetical protein